MDGIQASEQDDRKRGVWSSLLSRRYAINILLAFFAVGLELYYSLCGGACSYLRGDFIGIPLQYVGIVFMACVVLLSLFRADALLLALLSAGVGVEAYLVGFQIWHNTYCPYCIAFGGIIMILFVLNFDRSRKWLAVISMVLALILFPLLFEGSLTPSYAEEPAASAPSFGKGKTVVRLYTDYFCPPCRAMEPDVEPLILDLVKRNKITITFVDTPFSKHSAMYAKLFLNAIADTKDIKKALAARSVLNEAANQYVGDPAQIENLLAEKGFKIRPFDPKGIFDFYTQALKEDSITATPTCVVEYGGKQEKAAGGPDIVKVLRTLR